MPDDPTQSDQNQAPPPEPKVEEEKPIEENPQLDQPTPAEEPKPTEEIPTTPSETPTETPPSAEELPKSPEPQQENPPQQTSSPQSPESPKTEESKQEETKPPEEKPAEESKPEPEKPKEEKLAEPEVNVEEEVKKQMDEKAKQLFGENFFGEEAIHNFEEKCKGNGINVRFEIPTEFGYSDNDLEQGKKDEEEGKERLMVLRPEWMVVKEGNQDVRKPVTILNLRELFKKESRRLGRPTTVSYDNNPFGEGPVFFKYEPDWYIEQEFAKEPLKSGYSMPTKDVLPDSWSKTWEDQQKLFGEGERRREANEAVWDLLLSYAVTGQKLLTQRWDWTNSQTTQTSQASDEYRVSVRWNSDGLRVNYWSPGGPDPLIGVCSSR